MKFKIVTLGCKVNAYESEYMKECLLKSGFIYDDNYPDIVIINTCSVTNMADRKSRKIVHKEKREHPLACLVVAGCSSQNHSSDYEKMDIDILIGNKNKSKIVDLIKDYIDNHNKYTYFTSNRDLEFEDMKVEKFTTHTRAYIKIEDGCDNFCSYCIIPYVRGSIRSKDFQKVLEEARVLALNNHQEIVLTGIHTGRYQWMDKDLSDLIYELAKIPELKRIRLSSIEITELNDKFLELLKNEPKIVNHLHIPLQSGSDTVLKMMNRKYDTAYFKEKIAKIRRIRPDISITTDCIVGHPYETVECFKEYVDFCKEINFSKLHVFPYSKRDGTASSRMPQIDDDIKKERVKVLLELSKELEDTYASTFVGKKLLVLTEEIDGEYTTGLTSNYLKVYIKGKYASNQMLLVEITEIKNDKIVGEVVLSQE